MKPSAPSTTRVTHARNSALGLLQAENIVERSPTSVGSCHPFTFVAVRTGWQSRKTITQHESSRTSMLHARCLRHNRAQSQSAVARKHPEVESGREFPSFFTPIGSNRSVLMFGERKVGTFPCFRVQKFSAVYLRGVFSGCRSQSFVSVRIDSRAVIPKEFQNNFKVNLNN